MKNTYIAIIVLIILGVGAWFLLGVNKQAEAPTSETPEANMPAPDTNTDKNEPEKEVVKKFTVSGQNFSFTPSDLAVNKGDKVKITFKNLDGTHDFLVDEFSVNSGLVPVGGQKTVEFTADKIGSFQYYCSVGSHRAMGMWGTLIVN